MKLHLGCGLKKMEGWVNVDMQPLCNPDVVCNLEKFPWPWKDNSVSEIKLFHVLEHLGESRDIFIGVIQELYRICKDGAMIHIAVPHPRHNHFIMDPTHVRPLLKESFEMFDKHLNEQWIKQGFSNTPCALYFGVDFHVISTNYIVEDYVQQKMNNGELTFEDVILMINTSNNICSQINIELLCRKIDKEKYASLNSNAGYLTIAQLEGMPEFRFIVHSHDDQYISKLIRDNGNWESFETTVLRRILLQRQSRFVLNVGANIGWYAIVAGLILSEESRVVAIEPVLSNYSILCDNIELNGLKNKIEPLNMALSNTCGEGNMFLCADNQGDHRLNYEGGNRQSVPVKVSTIDALLSLYEELPDMLIMDTQGCEGLILQGAQQTFARGWNPIAFFEFWPIELVKTGIDPLSVFKLFADRGYTVFYIEGGNSLTKITEEQLRSRLKIILDTGSEEFIDFVAIPEGVQI